MTSGIDALLNRARKVREDLSLPDAARMEARRDQRDTAIEDPGIEATVTAALDWLGTAQDNSLSNDGGIARDYSLVSGWRASYPETSGYIVPTMLRGIPGHTNEACRNRARAVLDWLVSIQLEGGGFQGGVIGQTPVVPVTFNTGQILIGLASGVRELGAEYRAAMRGAADWLVRTQDEDGAWRSHPTPFAKAGEKAYETHVAWGLLEAEREEPARGYAETALRNISWALTKQRVNGWLADCCLNDVSRPLTHTIGYALRGIIEGYRFSRDNALLDAALLTAKGAMSALRGNGFLPGRLDPNWTGAVRWACLTGSAQIAHCWLLLYQITGDTTLRDAARRTNAYLRARVRVEGEPEVRGGVKGSFPVDGEYGKFEYLSWACKFFIDANLLEWELSSAAGGAGA
ncbi:MAG TPA: prenyltransferase/squalene oxidase repeat-containing protein [Gemmatimonadaceae bacterium]|nr:prenyltransferase/squalene oxidase repeat-containing protein [Gemmatimonadaceae bacterium]